MKRQPLVLVALFGLLVMAILPAQAALVTPTRVAGTSNCDTVESSAPLSFQIAPATTGTHVDDDTGVAFTLTITPTPSGRPSLAFVIDGGAAHDVILKGNTGSFANRYAYTATEGSPVISDSGLRAPTGTSLSHVWFCYEAEEPEGEPLPCGGTVSAADEETSGSFTRLFSGDCEEPKTAIVDIEVDEGEDVIVFIPTGEGVSNYSGVLTFTKGSGDDNLLVLRYDPDDDGAEPFRVMPACEDATFDGETGELIIATIPDGAGDTWCFYSVEGHLNQGGSWRVTWQVFGVADPRYK